MSSPSQKLVRTGDTIRGSISSRCPGGAEIHLMSRSLGNIQQPEKCVLSSFKAASEGGLEPWPVK